MSKDSLFSFRCAASSFVEKVSKDKDACRFLCKDADVGAVISGIGSTFLHAFFSPSQMVTAYSIEAGAVAFGISATAIIIFRGAVSEAFVRREAQRNNPPASNGAGVSPSPNG
jgi:hypothetical protein